MNDVAGTNGMYDTVAWRKFAAFQVLGDHTPMAGFRLVMQVGVSPRPLEKLIEHRAQSCDLLDPDLAQISLRSGLSLVRSNSVSFVYATADEALVLVRPEAVAEAGASMEIHDRLVSMFACRFALLLGRELPVSGRIYEFPDLEVVRRAFCTVQAGVEGTTTLRSSVRLGAQLRGRGLPFHPSMIESQEEQESLLEQNGVDLGALPDWWRRGVAARTRLDGAIEVFDELPAGDAFGELVEEA